MGVGEGEKRKREIVECISWVSVGERDMKGVVRNS